MNFEDFKNDPQQLLNQYVLYEYGMTYNSKNSLYIRKIIKVTKTGFKINGDAALFDINTGRQKGLNGRMHMGTVSICRLLTEEEATELSKKWRIKKEIKSKKLEIVNILEKCDDLDKIDSILKILKDGE
jgi:hypothetical protein